MADNSGLFDSLKEMVQGAVQEAVGAFDRTGELAQQVLSDPDTRRHVLHTGFDLLPDWLKPIVDPFSQELGLDETTRSDLSDVQLMALHRQLWSWLESVEPPETVDPKLGIAWSWWVMANRQAHVVALLCEQGLAVDAIPSLRMVIEYTFSLVLWSSERGTEAFGSLGLQALKNLAKIPGSNGAVLPLFGVLGDSMRAGNTSRRVWKNEMDTTLEKLDVKSEIAPVFNALSSVAHPSLMSLSVCVRRTDGRIRLSAQPRLTADLGDPLLWALQCQCWAGLALEQIWPAMLPYHQHLIQIADQIDLPLRDRLYPVEPPAA